MNLQFHCTFRCSACDLYVVPDTDSRMTCSTDTDSCVTCSKKYSFLINCVQLEGFPIDSHTLAWVRCMIICVIIHELWPQYWTCRREHSVQFQHFHRCSNAEILFSEDLHPEQDPPLHWEGPLTPYYQTELGQPATECSRLAEVSQLEV